jgi:hypothetical protein
MDKAFFLWFFNEIFQQEDDISLIDEGNVLSLSVKDKIFYIYIKSLTYAGNPYPENTTRAQLPCRSEFDSIKKSDSTFLFLGYDEKNEVFACWDPEKTKARLNEREYVSFFSRLNLQKSVKRGQILSAYLTNGLKYVLFKINDLPQFLLNYNDYFSNNNTASRAISSPTMKQDILHNINDNYTLKSFIDEMLDKDEEISTLTLVSNCMNKFGMQYPKMKLSDWHKLLNKCAKQRNISQKVEDYFHSSEQNNRIISNNAPIPANNIPTDSSNTWDRRGKPWTDNEEKLLVNYFKNGDSFASLAKIFGRTEVAIKMRLAMLGYIEYIFEQEANDDIQHQNEQSNNGQEKIQTSVLYSELKIIKFSENSIIIVGDTDRHKSELQEMGGYLLKETNWGPGWLFPASKRNVVQEYIRSGEYENVLEEPEDDIEEEVNVPETECAFIVKQEPLDTKKLDRVFDNTVTSYKYFWFVAIITLAKERKELSISYEKILIRMAALAWSIVLEDEISFGDKDMMSKYLKEIQRKTYIIKVASSRIVESSLLRYCDTMGIKQILSPLLKNVPYRFLSPWVKFTTNEEVVEKSKQKDFDGPYVIYPDRIVINSEWWKYIEQHYDEINDFIFRSFIIYAKKYNNDLRLVKLISKGKF